MLVSVSNFRYISKLNCQVTDANPNWSVRLCSAMPQLISTVHFSGEIEPVSTAFSRLLVVPLLHSELNCAMIVYFDQAQASWQLQ